MTRIQTGFANEDRLVDLERLTSVQDEFADRVDLSHRRQRGCRSAEIGHDDISVPSAVKSLELKNGFRRFFDHEI